jgi:hypothetical protein
MAAKWTLQRSRTQMSAESLGSSGIGFAMKSLQRGRAQASAEFLNGVKLPIGYAVLQRGRALNEHGIS